MNVRKNVNVGDIAPDFTAMSFTGEPIRLRERLAKGAVVLFFYPKDDSPVCTAEACAFRDSHEAFAEAGAEVIGISAGDEATQRRFSEKNHLPFLLLSDPDGAIRALYGAGGFLGLIPARITFVIDREGVVRHKFESLLDAHKHVQESLRTLRECLAA